MTRNAVGSPRSRILIGLIMMMIATVITTWQTVECFQHARVQRTATPSRGIRVSRGWWKWQGPDSHPRQLGCRHFLSQRPGMFSPTWGLGRTFSSFYFSLMYSSVHDDDPEDASSVDDDVIEPASSSTPSSCPSSLPSSVWQNATITLDATSGDTTTTTTTTMMMTTTTTAGALVSASALTKTRRKYWRPSPAQWPSLHRFGAAWPGKPDPEQRALDALIVRTAVPNMINLAVVPLVNAVDTFWVGRMGVALTLAGQAAANQAFFTIYFLVNYVPTLTAPLVAAAVGSGRPQEAQQRVCQSLVLSCWLGAMGTVLLVGFPRLGLSMVLPPGAPALEYAVPYLRWRALGMIPALVSATGFAAYRGMLDTVTPLQVSLATNLFNLVLDPILIFWTPMRVLGAALATALAETLSGLTYSRLMLQKKLVSVAQLLRPPPLATFMPLLQGGISMLGRQMAINVAIVAAARRAHALDPTGVVAAAYGIVMQLYAIGIVVHVAMQGTAAALVPSTLARSGVPEARRVADRLFIWNFLVGGWLGLIQWAALPWLAPLFSTLPEVQEAVRRPAFLASLLHVINGPVFAGEGIMLGLGNYRDLMLITAASVVVLATSLSSPWGKFLDGILYSKMLFCSFQALAVVWHVLNRGPLAARREKKMATTS